jgi:cytochrome c biogenesis protein CcmG/thiol:disulfide interchange protein DsbE
MSDAPEPDVEPQGSGFRLWMMLPALGAVAVLAVFLLGLGREDGGRNLPSTFIGKPAPEFELPPLREGQPGLSSADMTAPGVKLVNIWASWCVPCRVEHPQLTKLAAMGIPVHGINYKDTDAAAEKFLAELGDPFTLIGADRKGRVGIEWGVYGVPETFVVDGQGRIVYKHIGPIQGSDIERKILPAVEKARAGG